MHTLSLRQPYAELIVQGKKTIEVRKWNTKFRGKFLIHSSKNIFLEDCKKLKIDSDTLIRGAVIGSAELVDVKKYKTLEEFRKDFGKHCAEDRWFKKGTYGFILRNGKRLEAKTCKGSLGFFEVDF